MRRYLRIYRHFLASSLVRELEFRANFFAKLLQNLAWLFFFLLILLVVYGNADEVAGWDRNEALVLGATSYLVYNLFVAFCMSLLEIPEQVRRGTLDFIATKPVDSQFWVSLRRFNFDQIGAAVAGFAMLGFGLVQAKVSPDLGQWTAYSILVYSAILIFYSIQFALMTLGIWLVRVDNLWVLGETLWTITRYPVDIYSAAIQRFFVFVVPVAFLATVPTRQLLAAPDWGWVAGGLSWGLAAFWASRLFWLRAMRSYSSASS